jgi:uncharacterized membrane protein YedE/YeeE
MRMFLSVFASGLVFGVGLALSGMTHSEKVLGFLDVSGRWDPSLLFVLGGAVAVTLTAFRYVLRRGAPVLEAEFLLPARTDVDRQLVLGAVIFGVGWGITGYCPGPGLALLASPSWETWVYVPAFFVGAFLHRAFGSTLLSGPIPLRAQCFGRVKPSDRRQ